MWARPLVFTHPSNPCDSVKSTTSPTSSPPTTYSSRKPTTITPRYINAPTTSVSTFCSMLLSSVFLAPPNTITPSVRTRERDVLIRHPSSRSRSNLIFHDVPIDFRRMSSSIESQAWWWAHGLRNEMPSSNQHNIPRHHSTSSHTSISHGSPPPYPPVSTRQLEELSLVNGSKNPPSSATQVQESPTCEASDESGNDEDSR